MNDMILAAIGGFLLGYLYRRESWRIENWLAARWPTRCDKCGVWLQTRNTQPVKLTTDEWVNLCGPCFKTEYHPWTP